MLTISEINQSYGQSHTLRNLNLSIAPRSCVSLIGRNGVGKTTLLKCIMGLLSLDSGNIIYDDSDLTREPTYARVPMRMGYVPQGRLIFPLLTVEENLSIGLGALSDEEQYLPELIFEVFPVLKTMLKRRGGDLSGGQQQQLAIARALAIRPRLLLLDEPTEGIQPNLVQEIAEIIIYLNRELGLTVLVVEQKLPFVRHVASDFNIMSRGTIVSAGKMTDLSETIISEYLLSLIHI